MMDRFKESFREEAYELLNSLEEYLLVLEEQPDDSRSIDAIFRCVHTIKGSAAMFGFQGISVFAHEVEDVLDKVRAGSVLVKKRLIDLTLQARDHIRFLLDSGESETEGAAQATEALLEAFREYGRTNQKASPRPEPEESVAKPPLEGCIDLATWRLHFQPQPGIFMNGTRPLQLIQEICDMGDTTIQASCPDLPTLDLLKVDTCYYRWDVLITTERCKNEMLDVFMFAQDQAAVDIKLVDNPEDDPANPVPLGKILIDRGSVAPQTIDQAIHTQKRLGDILQEQGVPPQLIQDALEEQEHIKRARQKAQVEVSANTIRVNSEKLDVLVDLVGELVTLQARLSQVAGGLHVPALNGINESFERLAGELRDNAMAIRMLPIGSTFSKFKRLVRDLSGELGKDVELVAEGADTELDKTVLERLNDPLVHLIRNSLDHGIESPEGRRAAGKSERGTIKLQAEHAGAIVAISIVDDGKGIDCAAVRAKAIERGVLAPNANLSDEEAQQLIFLPGFSTAKTVTNVSGRGVGMDVVKKEIEALGGVIRIKSEKGQGTNIRLEIPLTLAIIEGLLVRTGAEHYIVPLSIVEECLEYRRENELDNGARKMLQYRDELLPLVHLRELFGGFDASPDIQQVVVANVQGQKLGLVLDQVIGDHQTVIKNLGRLYRDAEGISGATIMGDGSVALILDVADMIERMKAPRQASA